MKNGNASIRLPGRKEDDWRKYLVVDLRQVLCAQ